jgi:hypothetical protein
MKDADIIETMVSKLRVPVGRHLYGVVGSYDALERFSRSVLEAKTPDGLPFPEPISINKGIFAAIPENEFKRLAEDEPRYPEVIRVRLAQAFEEFLRLTLRQGLIVLRDLEVLFTYDLDLSPFRTLCTDKQRAILLLPGERSGERICMFGSDDTFLPVDLIASDHLWILR